MDLELPTRMLVGAPVARRDVPSLARDLATPVATSRLADPTHLLRGTDALVLGMAGLIGHAGADGPASWLGLMLFAILALVVIQALDLYGRDGVVVRVGLLDELPRLLQAVSLGAAGAALVTAELTEGQVAGIPTAWLSACVLLPISRKAVRWVVIQRSPPEGVLVLGSGVIASLLATKIAKHPELGLRLVGCVDSGENDRPLVGPRPPLLGTLADVEHVIAEHDIKRVVIAFSAVPHDDLLDAIRRCKRAGMKIDVVPRLFEVIGDRVDLHDIEGLTLLGLRGPVRSKGARLLKRVMDVTGSAFAVLLLSPVMLLIALAIRLTSPGPVFFRQERIGLGQQPFQMLKFRTMVQDAEALKPQIAHLNETFGGEMFKIALDPRVTRVGRFLRATSLDELPQFLNVLCGEMSIVGPRPLIRQESDAVAGWHRTRLDLTPGLTGPWQVMGRQHVPFDEMVKIDYLYVAEWSLWNDVKLALRTLPVMVRAKGA